MTFLFYTFETVEKPQYLLFWADFCPNNEDELSQNNKLSHFKLLKVVFSFMQKNKKRI